MLNYMPYMQMMGLPAQYRPMMEMPQNQLEAMYPKTYNIIHPHIEHHCQMHEAMHGMNHTPTHEEMEAMVNDIQKNVEADVDAEVNNPKQAGERQLGFGGRRLLRDLISILLIRQLIGRRHPYYGGYPGGYGYYPGMYGGFPGSYYGY